MSILDLPCIVNDIYILLPQLPPLPPKVEELDDNDSSLENLTAERQGWMRDRMRKLFARIESGEFIKRVTKPYCMFLPDTYICVLNCCQQVAQQPCSRLPSLFV